MPEIKNTRTARKIGPRPEGGTAGQQAVRKGNRKEADTPAIVSDCLATLRLKPINGAYVSFTTETNPFEWGKFDAAAQGAILDQLWKVYRYICDSFGLETGNLNLLDKVGKRGLHYMVKRIKGAIDKKAEVNIDLVGDDCTFTLYKSFPSDTDTWYVIPVKPVLLAIGDNDELREVFTSFIAAFARHYNIATWADLYDYCIDWQKEEIERMQQELQEGEPDFNEDDYNLLLDELNEYEHGAAAIFSKELSDCRYTEPATIVERLAEINIPEALAPVAEMIKAGCALMEQYHVHLWRLSYDESGADDSRRGEYDYNFSIIWQQEDWCSNSYQEYVEHERNEFGASPATLNVKVDVTKEGNDLRAFERDCKALELFPSELETTFLTIFENIKKLSNEPSNG